MVILMEKKIKDIIRESLELDDDVVEHLGYEQELFDIGLDSIKAIEMIVIIEDTFNIVVEDEDLLLDNMKSISKICELIQKYCGYTIV